MARFAHTAARSRGPAESRTRGPAALSAVLLAVLVTLLGPSVLGSEHPWPPGGTVAGADTAASAGSMPHAVDPAPSEPYAENAEPGDPAATVRSHRDATGERHAPPLSAPGASRNTAADPRPLPVAPGPAALPPASAYPALGHGVRAPPSPSGN
ncbi:hypothetical protein GCM10010277_09000 [Streptomyces longisporoflavus]|uniref:hypothetical protein n=1 Tax=Streptomyces longisporoflavus TaxID=28044 RepID=UPI00167EC781|nr:hypothetical protein [Streptomyces longisporoflavus]GGV27444.1 hypothetical protein GCM10010277_09000 [Streptomyces longisporoflavus]